jgi:hypothetical protein
LLGAAGILSWTSRLVPREIGVDEAFLARLGAAVRPVRAETCTALACSAAGASAEAAALCAALLGIAAFVPAASRTVTW